MWVFSVGEVVSVKIRFLTVAVRALSSLYRPEVQLIKTAILCWLKIGEVRSFQWQVEWRAIVFIAQIYLLLLLYKQISRVRRQYVFHNSYSFYISLLEGN